MFCFSIPLIFSALCSFLKVFSAKRGHLKLFIQSQEFFRTLQRHYSNTCIDANKQAAINLYVFTGYKCLFGRIVCLLYFICRSVAVSGVLIGLFPLYFRFLGYFQPQQGKPALWELESSSGEHKNELFDDHPR